MINLNAKTLAAQKKHATNHPAWLDEQLHVKRYRVADGLHSAAVKASKNLICTAVIMFSCLKSKTAARSCLFPAAVPLSMPALSCF